MSIACSCSGNFIKATFHIIINSDSVFESALVTEVPKWNQMMDFQCNYKLLLMLCYMILYFFAANYPWINNSLMGPGVFKLYLIISK